jgi:ribosomal protein S18 acetylase RimI-like enzyme
VTSRDYARNDYEACLEVFDTNVPRFFRPEERVEYAAFLKALPGPYVVLLDGSDRVIACGGYAIREENASADLCWGMVREELHGRGLGKALARLRIARVLKDFEVREIVLNTSQHTVGFYEGLGFQATTVQADGYAPGLDRCEMQLDVRP